MSTQLNVLEAGVINSAFFTETARLMREGFSCKVVERDGSPVVGDFSKECVIIAKEDTGCEDDATQSIVIGTMDSDYNFSYKMSLGTL